jgi:SAM-dependent methyltransferase
MPCKIGLSGGVLIYNQPKANATGGPIYRSGSLCHCPKVSTGPKIDTQVTRARTKPSQSYMLSTIKFITGLKISEVIAPDDRMYNNEAREHYFYVGRSDLFVILNSLSVRASYFAGDTAISRILDFGCGHGRVTRWLRSAFPNADISVTDIDANGANFCCEKFACKETSGRLAANTYDLVWLGSVFTHLPERPVERLMGELCNSLAENGVLIFTSQGRYSIERMRGFNWSTDGRAWMHYNIERQLFEDLVRQYHAKGYGYVDYPNQVGYGVSIAKPSWYSDRILSSAAMIQILLQEKGADNHQDVSAFMRAELTDPRKGPLW